MKKIVRKLFMDFEKEENYLNRMSEKGWALMKYTWGKYEFVEAPKGEYIYRIELLEYPLDDSRSKDYINFMEEIGAELITTSNRWIYFRRKAIEGDFDLYSDIDSRLQHYNRIQVLFLIIMGVNFFIGFYNLYIGQTLIKSSFPDINSYMAILSLLLGTIILIFISIPLWKKIGFLEKEKQIRE